MTKTILTAMLCTFTIPLVAQRSAAAPTTQTTAPSGTAYMQTSTPSSSRPASDFDPRESLRNARTVYLKSKSSFLLVVSLDRTLLQQKDWPKLGLTIVQNKSEADLVIELDRPIFTRVHTFVITDQKTSAVLGAGRVIAFDGTIACGGLAKDIVKIVSAAKLPASPKQ